MMIQEAKVGMRVQNAGGDIFEIKEIHEDYILVKMLEHNGDGFAVNYIHQTFIPGQTLEIAQSPAHDMLLSGWYEVSLEYLEPVEAENEETEETEENKKSEIPVFQIGVYVKDKFGSVYKVVDAKPRYQLDRESFIYDSMGYRLELIHRAPKSPAAKVQDDIDFRRVGDVYWIYNSAEDLSSDEYEDSTDTFHLYILANELKLVNLEFAEQLKAASRYPSIEDLQKISEENDHGKLLDQAYEILKEQASLGERNANLHFETFKRCIPHFVREGFEVLEHGTLINVRW